MSTVDDDVIIESGSSGTATPMASNPGTPRSLDTDVRNTPPPVMTHSRSATNLQVQPSLIMQSMSNTNLQALGAVASTSVPVSSIHQLQQQHPRVHVPPQSKYGQLLAVIEDMGKDIRPTYAGSKTSAERLKRGIVHARILVRECLMECERAART